MSKHAQIRQKVKDAIIPYVTGVTFFDGRPFFIDAQELPAIAIYLTDAISISDTLDTDSWQAIIHITLFLEAKNPDTELDQWIETLIYPALNTLPSLISLIDVMTSHGYDYQRDDDVGLWCSADLTYHIQYVL